MTDLIDEKYDFIYKFLENYDVISNNKLSTEQINVVYDLFKNDKIYESNDAVVVNYYGTYYEIKKDYDKAEKYFLMAIDNGSNLAMNNLGYLYNNIKKDYDKAEKYYLMAIDSGNVYAMYNLGCLYVNIKKDYDKAEKYYLMAIDNGSSSAMNNLGYLYDSIKKDYDKAEKYYLIAIDSGNVYAMYNLGCSYENIKKDYDKAEKYYLMAIQRNCIYPVRNLIIMYERIDQRTYIHKITQLYRNDMMPEMKKTIADAIFEDIWNKHSHLVMDNIHILVNVSENNLHKKCINDIFTLKNKYTELYYAPGNPGFKDSEQDFKNQLTKN